MLGISLRGTWWLLASMVSKACSLFAFAALLDFLDKEYAKNCRFSQDIQLVDMNLPLQILTAAQSKDLRNKTTWALANLQARFLRLHRPSHTDHFRYGVDSVKLPSSGIGLLCITKVLLSYFEATTTA